MQTKQSDSFDEDFKKAATDPFWKPLAEMTEEEKLTQALKAQMWVGILSDILPQINRDIKEGKNLEHHWNVISFGVRLLEWDITNRKSIGESALDAEGAMESLLETKRDIMEQIGK